MRVKEESEKAGLKLNIQRTKVMASGPVTSWQIDGEAMETVTGFIFFASKSLQTVTAALKLKTPWKKSYDKPRQCVKNSHFVDEGGYGQSYGFSNSHVWICELDHKEVESQRIDAFKKWCWRRLLRFIWTTRRSN